MPLILRFAYPRVDALSSCEVLSGKSGCDRNVCFRFRVFGLCRGCDFVNRSYVAS